MFIFFLGLLLGALSGGGTYHFTDDALMAAVVAGVAAICTWCGKALLLLLIDE
jgi:hypothetical protein